MKGTSNKPLFLGISLQVSDARRCNYTDRCIINIHKKSLLRGRKGCAVQ